MSLECGGKNAQIVLADANLDLDGDGQSNLAEYIAGTAPDNANDYFKQTLNPGPPLSVTVAGVAGRTYILQRNTSSFDPLAWAGVITNGPVAVSGDVMLTDPSPPVDAAFYRTVVTYP